MRGRETRERSTSRCPDPACCSLPPADLAIGWDGLAWPSARVHSHLLAAMPPGVFPGVDDTEVLRFLERQAEPEAPREGSRPQSSLHSAGTGVESCAWRGDPNGCVQHADPIDCDEHRVEFQLGHLRQAVGQAGNP